MKTIYLLRGLPASGKSTWAKKQVAENNNIKRVNKDDLREMLDNSKWTKANEKFVLDVRDFIITQALEQGFSVIVDDTNLHHKHEIRMRELAREYGKTHKNHVQVSVINFDTTLQECIARDQRRDKFVGAEVITSMYDRYINNDLSKEPLEKVWVISDTHFTHQMFIDEGIRPANYNEQIIENWNKLVAKDDLVIHLGDVIFGHEKERIKDILAGLNGRKILVKGNHDYKPDQWWLKMGFEHVYDTATYGDVIFSHIPMQIPQGYKTNIHGHLHNSTHRTEEVQDVLTKNHLLVALEITGYKPIKLEDLIFSGRKVDENTFKQEYLGDFVGKED